MSSSTTGAAQPQRASGETPNPWLRLLCSCSLVSLVLAAAGSAAGGAVSGLAAAASVAAAVALVVVFFGITLLIGHVVGLRNPRAALGAFMFGYVVKVVGFGAVVFLLGTPAWVDAAWFIGASVGTVIAWQATEMIVFSRLRFQLYDDGAPDADSQERGAREAA
ncbi:hypothetical protein [Zhihengliuella salsuginis]|uniref:ATP synthase protein I n=1 Tax=Zhihengliuella salsuginis TaxID=578222 RepID=A0ABQ3GIC4_9MICC|nr:hypothetical protein [Zhihengliuella salsuginis]GHD08583.1 hypothetical protein GCM10008096_20380 [Zhihengliuella salsuginis]